MAKKKKSNNSIFTFLPVLVGILLTPAAMRFADVLALSGPDGMTLLYPWVEFVKSPALRISADVAMQASQWIMYVQFPIYGLIMMRYLRAGRALAASISVLLIHVAAILAVGGLGYLQGNHIKGM
jgi:hypothetical protein